MTIPALKVLLHERELALAGKKAKLVERLEKHWHDHVAASSKGVTPAHTHTHPPTHTYATHTQTHTPSVLGVSRVTSHVNHGSFDDRQGDVALRALDLFKSFGGRVEVSSSSGSVGGGADGFSDYAETSDSDQVESSSSSSSSRDSDSEHSSSGSSDSGSDSDSQGDSQGVGGGKGEEGAPEPDEEPIFNFDGCSPTSSMDADMLRELDHVLVAWKKLEPEQRNGDDELWT